MIALQHDGLSRPVENPRLRILSLGAGVQSSTLALMAAEGELGDPPDAAIFADTQAEPDGVYRWLEWLEPRLPFPVHRVTRGDLRAEVLDASKGVRNRLFRIPAFVEGEDGRAAPLTRTCTDKYKIMQIDAKVRALLGLKHGEAVRHFLGLKRSEPVPAVVEQWIGISTDELERLRVSRKPWQYLRYPLIEARMSRRDCLRWLEVRGYPKPAKSACTFCPWHDNAAWRDLRDNDPAGFADAVEVDRAMRADGLHFGMRSKAYLHRDLVPLDEVDLTAPDEGGLGFVNECSGHCGV
jgi:hypothetical protein